MKTLIFLLALTAAPTHAADLNKREIIRAISQSSVLKGVQAGVKKDYGMTKCTKFQLSEGSTYDRIKATSLCTYQDKWGDETGVGINVEGTLYDDSVFFLNNIEFVFAG